jgi:tRNA nucleotidyltransferase (CCA-adding enzyme)
MFRLLQEIGSLAEAFHVSAFLVGGMVRDFLLGLPNQDMDIVVEGDGMAFARHLADHYRGGLKIFDRFATAYVVLPDRTNLDVSNTRAEQPPHSHTTSPGGWPIPSQGFCSIEQDLMRRDFTVNALAIHLNAGRFGTLLDPSGGLQDLRTHTIRAVYESIFEDDPTRVFRALRFAQRFGFRIEARTLSLLKDVVANGLANQLPGHRVRKEVMLLLAEQDPARAIRRMAAFDLLHAIHPELKLTPRNKPTLDRLPKALKWWHDRFPNRLLDRPLVYFTALMDELTVSETDTVLTRLVVGKRQADKVQIVKSRVGHVLQRLSDNPDLKPSGIYRLFEGLPDEALVLLVAKARTKHVRGQVSAYVTRYQQTHPAISGKHLAAMGLREGPTYKKVLDKVMNAKLNGTVTTESEEQALAQRFIKKMAG